MPNLSFELLLWTNFNIYVDCFLDVPIGEQVCTDQKEEGARLARSDGAWSAHEQLIGCSHGVGERELLRRLL